MNIYVRMWVRVCVRVRARERVCVCHFTYICYIGEIDSWDNPRAPSWTSKLYGITGRYLLYMASDIGDQDDCHQLSNITRILAGNILVDQSHVVGASPVGAAPNTPSFSTKHLASIEWPRTTATGGGGGGGRESFKLFVFGVPYIREFTVYLVVWLYWDKLEHFCCELRIHMTPLRVVWWLVVMACHPLRAKSISERISFNRNP